MHVILAALSLGAAAIHLAAGPAHVEALGDVGLGFYWAAFFQAAIAIGFLRAPRGRPGRTLTRFALAGNLAISAAWVISRTVGLPLSAGGPEAVGTADLIATVMQAAMITLLVTGANPAWRAAIAPHTEGRETGMSRGVVAGAGMVVLAVIAMSSSIAVADAATGHAHAPGMSDDHHGPPAHADDDDARPAHDHGYAPVAP